MTAVLAPPAGAAPTTMPDPRPHPVPGSAARTRRRRALGWFALLAGPNVALLVLFVYKPLVESFYLSTMQWNLGSPVARFVGLGNYVEWFTADSTARVLTTTAVFTLTTVGGALVLGLGLALLLDGRLPGRGLARTVAFAPYVLSGYAVGILWLFIFDPRYGLLSVVLGWFGRRRRSGTRPSRGPWS